MSIPRVVIVLFIAFAVTGSGLAQDKPAGKKAKPVLVRQGVPRLVFPKPKPIVFEGLIQVRTGVFRPDRVVNQILTNPLMQGEYKTALDVFDRVRAKLSMPKDTKIARRLLDDLDYKLIAVRGALWKAEKRAKDTRMHVFETFLTLTPSFPHLVFPNPNAQLVFGGQFAGKMLVIDGKWVVDNGTNPFVRGDYRNAVVALTKTRTSLDRVRDPKAARRIVDTLNRMLLDVRRELWKIEQAQKKK